MNDRWIAGVCSGLADYFGLDPTVVRVAYLLLSILSVGFRARWFTSFCGP